ncbi:MAG TPA: hypothetical protein PK929_17460 [Quisquiliibacterium sp.]|nr:hypothetical protein [Quisquiliibacterium sp.]
MHAPGGDGREEVRDVEAQHEASPAVQRRMRQRRATAHEAVSGRMQIGGRQHLAQHASLQDAQGILRLLDHAQATTLLAHHEQPERVRRAAGAQCGVEFVFRYLDPSREVSKRLQAGLDPRRVRPGRRRNRPDARQIRLQACTACLQPGDPVGVLAALLLIGRMRQRRRDVFDRCSQQDRLSDQTLERGQLADTCRELRCAPVRPRQFGVQGQIASRGTKQRRAPHESRRRASGQGARREGTARRVFGQHESGQRVGDGVDFGGRSGLGGHGRWQSGCRVTVRTPRSSQLLT